MYNPQKKHKAQHGGYHKKPSQRGVNALMGLYEAIDEAVKPKVGEQLKLNFTIDS